MPKKRTRQRKASAMVLVCGLFQKHESVKTSQAALCRVCIMYISHRRSRKTGNHDSV